MARLASTSSEDGITWPLPVIAVEMASLLLAVAAGMCTTGALPNAPETVTAELGSAEPEEPQPTRARPASRGTTSAAEIRRMRILSVGDLAGALGRRAPGGGLASRVARAEVSSASLPATAGPGIRTRSAAELGQQVLVPHQDRVLAHVRDPGGLAEGSPYPGQEARRRGARPGLAEDHETGLMPGRVIPGGLRLPG